MKGNARVAIVDYGAGNLTSVKKAFAAVGCEPAIVSGRDALGDFAFTPGDWLFNIRNLANCSRLRNCRPTTLRFNEVGTRKASGSR